MPQQTVPHTHKTQEDLSPQLSDSQKRELVQRVLESQSFSRSPALRGFLVYITDHEIRGEADKLKEQTIGTEVLGRKPNYDPADDNIVRVRAHELRGRLDRYFAAEGENEPVIITIPRGAYAPEFVPRLSASPLAESQLPKPPAAEPSQSVPQETPAVGSSPISGRHLLIFGAVVLIAIAATAGITRYVVSGQIPAGSAQPSVAVRDFWGQFFEKPGDELKVVYSDTSFALWQDLNGQTLDLGDYLNRKYLDVHGNQLFNVVMRRVTTPTDMALSVRFATLAMEFGGQASPQFARDVDSQFFHHGNVVLIGSHRSNPWVSIFEPSLNFFLAQNPESGAPEFHNRSPKPQEPQVFAIPAMFDTQKTEEKSYISYGVVALLKGCGDHGMTVLVEGLNTQATQAAGDLATDPQRLDMLLRSIGHRPGTQVTPFEALFQITSVPGGYDDPRVIAYRLRSPEACVGG